MRSLNEYSRYCHDVRSSVYPSVRVSVHVWDYNHAVYASADLSLWLDSPIFGAPDTKTLSPIPSRLFPVRPVSEVGYGCEN